MSEIIKLELYEIYLAADVGVRRRTSSLAQKNNQDGYYAGGATTRWQTDIEGACAELAFAKHLGVYWDGSVNIGKAPDVAGYQVRHSERNDARLIIRPGDPDDDRYVLVTGNHFDGFFVRGWCFPNEARVTEFETDPGGKGMAWFIPQSELYTEFDR